ncbi:hypothetical protein [Caulobacter sp. BK020]|nr:hypothetical protein [Caulobacter sp. BK020]
MQDTPIVGLAFLPGRDQRRNQPVRQVRQIAANTMSGPFDRRYQGAR